MGNNAYDLYDARSLKAKFNGKHVGIMGICMILLAIFLAAPARGQVFFNDLGTGSGVYNTLSEVDITGSGSKLGATYDQADLFQTVAGGAVSQIDLGVTNFYGNPEFTASIYTDADGVPGTRVSGAYWSVTTVPLSFGTCCDLAVVHVTGVTLAPDTDYFMVLSPVSPTADSFNVWNLSGLGTTGLNLISQNGGPWLDGFGPTLGAFEIEGSPTPEPSSFVLCLVGIMGAMGALQIRRRKRNQLAGI
jgi:hypothetical protein